MTHRHNLRLPFHGCFENRLKDIGLSMLFNNINDMKFQRAPQKDNLDPITQVQLGTIGAAPSPRV